MMLQECTGFAKIAGCVGGLGYGVHRVTSTSDGHEKGTLRYALERAWASGGGYIRLECDGEHRLGKNIHLADNITIDGCGYDYQIIADVGGIKAYGVDNWILYNFAIDCVGKTAAIVGRRSPDHYWLHHLDITGGTDDTVAIEHSTPGKVSRGTISYCHWADTAKGILITDWLHDTKERLQSVTVHNNWFQRVGQRCPNVMCANAHIFNNYVDSWNRSVTAILCREAAVVHVEKNVFDATPEYPIGTRSGEISTSKAPRGYLRGDDNLLTGDAVIEEWNREAVPNFHSFYDYQAQNADNRLREWIKRYAGRL